MYTFILYDLDEDVIDQKLLDLGTQISNRRTSSEFDITRAMGMEL